LEAEFGERFVRIHRSALIAVDRIERIERDAEGKSRVVLRDDSQVDDKELIISRRHAAEVKRRLKES
jgi:two-component system response regulator AlgR